MSKVIVYLRVSTDMQDVANQRHGVEAFCRLRGVGVNHWVEDTVSGGKAIAARKLGKVVKSMKEGDTLIAAEISRLSRNMMELMGLLQTCLTKRIRVFTVKEGFELGDNINSKLMIVAFGLAAEIERNMISQRTKEGMARRKAEGMKLGRPVGSKKKNPVLAVHADYIRRRLAEGATQKEIARKLKVCRQTVGMWVKENAETEITTLL